MTLRTLSNDCNLQRAHFGKPAQSFSKEDQEFLKKLCLNKTVLVEFHSMDQYGRAVCFVHLPSLEYFTLSPKSSLSYKLVKAGLAHVYTGWNAQYGKHREWLIEAENTAKVHRIGIWTQNLAVSPMEFKRRI